MLKSYCFVTQLFSCHSIFLEIIAGVLPSTYCTPPPPPPSVTPSTNDDHVPWMPCAQPDFQNEKPCSFEASPCFSRHKIILKISPCYFLSPLSHFRKQRQSFRLYFSYVAILLPQNNMS
jgi:hypothetical protein